METNFFPKDQSKSTSNVSFIGNLKKPVCASKSEGFCEGLVLTTLQ
jgi:hypothetical protein